MELLAFSPSDDGEDMDVLEYEDADSELVDEDMRSTTASIENMEDDATVSVEDMDDAASSSAEGMSDTASSSVEDMDDADSAEEDIATRDDEDQDSDSSLEYESNGDEAGPLSITTVAVHEKMKYMSVGFYDTEEMAERSLHQLNQFDYSYKTRYVLTFRVGKEFECHSHNGCHHRIKIVTHQAGEMVDCGGISVERSEKLGPAQPIKDAEVTFLSLQQVTVDRRALAQMNPLIPRSKWRFDEKNISIGSDGENMMTSRYSGVVTQLEEAATYRILGVWYMPRPTNLVVINATNQIDDGECARHVYPSSVWFGERLI
ncbi:hypothetical protein PC119_g19280 [Phytophthora cactorum]|nr:hypothetical protein PC119_g19280 [Phytophthora cactorum]KAG3138084.1 hypothetical protein C6341_g20769 [Phytophthora cactorum]